MGTHTRYWFSESPVDVVGPGDRHKHPASGIEASRAWAAHSTALELQGLATDLVPEHARSVGRDRRRRRTRRSLVLLVVLALMAVASFYAWQLNTWEQLVQG